MPRYSRGAACRLYTQRSARARPLEGAPPPQQHGAARRVRGVAVLEDGPPSQHRRDDAAHERGVLVRRARLPVEDGRGVRARLVRVKVGGSGSGWFGLGVGVGVGVGVMAKVRVAVSARASGRQMTKSASLPTAIAPLLVSPAIFAGSEESHCHI